MTACRHSIIAVLALCLGASMTTGCMEFQVAETPLAERDQDAYADLVQPYVGLRCGSLDCHGDSGRPLRLYAEHGLRSSDALRGQPITIAETTHNVASFAGVDPDHDDTVGASRHLAMLKALAVDAGGFAHEGGDVWNRLDQPGYLCVLGWLENRAVEVTVQDACANATLEVMPQP
jgi:hypothetical protein